MVAESEAVGDADRGGDGGESVVGGEAAFGREAEGADLLGGETGLSQFADHLGAEKVWIRA